MKHNLLISFCFIGRCHMNIQIEMFVKEPSEHSHAPDPDRVHVIRLKNEIKSRNVLLGRDVRGRHKVGTNCKRTICNGTKYN
jgi:hypothetical protein